MSTHATPGGVHTAPDQRATDPDQPAADRPTDRPGVRQRLAAAHRRLRRWWLWTERPLSYAAAWRLSAVDRRRLPKASPWWLPKLWQLGNATERLLWFACMLVAPSGLQGLLRWAVVRPTRRLGAYLLLAAAAVGLYVSTRGR